MAFDKTKPSDTEKLRDLGSVIRDNWDGIVEAQSSFAPEALNFLDRTGGAISPTDPSAIAGDIIAYSKQDGSGKPQLFTIDPDSVIRQLTGNVTSATVVIGGNTYTHYTAITPWGITLKFGLAEASPSGVSCSFAPAFASAAYGIVITVRASGYQGNSYDSLSTAGFTAYCQSGQQVIAFVAWGA